MCEEVYENTHIERVNETIKDQYLNRIEIRDEHDLKQKVARVIENYNDKRPHQSLQKLTPMQYEEYLKSISKENRLKMEIYTVQKDHEHPDPNQLKMVFT